MNAIVKAPVYDAVTVERLLHMIHPVCSDEVVPDPPEGFLTFFDPGWSILGLRRVAAGKWRLFCPQGWYKNQPFAHHEGPPRYRQLQMEPVPESFGKTFAEQQALVPPDGEIPTARVVLMGLVIHFLASGERLLHKGYVRCVDQTVRGDLVGVGAFARDGVSFGYGPNVCSDVALGVVLSRKF